MNASAEPTGGTAAAPARLARGAPGLLLLYGLGLWLLGEASVESAPLAIALSVISWLAFTALLFAITAGLVAWPLRPAVVVLLLLGGALGWYLLAYRLGDRPPAIAGVAATLCMVVAMAALGRVLGWLFREPGLLPPALVLAGVVDIWGVNQGVVAKVAEQSAETITKASATVPGVAARSGAFALADLSIGPGDIAVAALILAVAVQHGFDLRRNLLWMYGLTIIGLSLVLATGWLVPGLVFIGAAGLLANRERFIYTPAEKKTLAVAAGLIAILLVLGTVALRTARQG